MRLAFVLVTGLVAAVMTHPPGSQANPRFTAQGGAARCEMRVVPCNYAKLYSGTFGWTITLNGPKSRYSENVQVGVKNGMATCSGVATSTFEGRTRRGPIAGPALFAVEWMDGPEYRVTVACPTPDWPAGPDGEPATPSRPAELGHNEQTTDEQQDPSVARMTMEQAIASLSTLKGTLSYPAPEADPLNGVDGTTTITWNLRKP